MSASTTARARARAELTNEITSTARRHLAEVGAAALSLRAVARELGMASSAVYRYFPSRDDLLTALIVEGYEALGDAAEEGERAGSGPFVERWVTLAAAIRRWALASPHEYALLYGSPVPGYRAPTDTVGPATRASGAALRVAAAGVAAGDVDPSPRLPLPEAVGRDVAHLRVFAPDLSDELLARGLHAWTALFGALTFELFGHLENVIIDVDAYAEHQARRSAMLFAAP